ncbi:anthrax toxin-like adenylyl cyclase domain-containing protein [Brevibacillus parabrevis]|jgi:MAC/Perforin domain./Ricin-type beta-trefoil lectin domain./Anthrax toxin LF subunit.|uniref:anthrax toxin-like adenylyl cyclase domain-containing protein n=1 Tax=Brevibacillus parabrevis TaxID=54914 RepID=UPI002492AB6C|nr:anthrax toxin-like adenylyl cyclase domain-containing protein [Brevibacillus parabrevis]
MSKLVEVQAEELRKDGIPLAYVQAFLQAAKKNDSIVITRAPGLASEGLLAEGYDAKGKQIQAMPSKSGPMAGFVCLDPLLNPDGLPGWLATQKRNKQSLSKKEGEQACSASPLVISDKRLDWLINEQKWKANKESEKLYSGTVTLPAKEGGAGEATAFSVVLVKQKEDRWALYYDVFAAYGLKYEADFEQDAVSTLANACTKMLGEAIKEEGKQEVAAFFKEIKKYLEADKALENPYAHYRPVYGLTNPVAPYAEDEKYRNCVTNDIGLFSIWPKKAERVKEQVTAITKELTTAIFPAPKEGQGAKVPASLTRFALTPAVGRPVIDSTDSLIAFSPNGHVYRLTDTKQLAEWINECHGSGYTILLEEKWKNDWLPHVKEVQDKVTWSSFSGEGKEAPAKDGKAEESKEKEAQEKTTSKDIKTQALKEKEEQLAIRAKEIELLKKEKALDDEAAKLHDSNDLRQNLINKVKVAIPKLMGKEELGPTLKDIKSDDFAKKEDTSLIQLSVIKEKKDPQLSDFFMLHKNLRDDLLDRTGFFRGIVIDYSYPEIMQQSFRNVLASTTEQVKQQEIVPTEVYYRKPRYSGYFDNQYTFSELVHQLQKNGVSNFGASLTIAAAVPSFGAGVGVGYSQSDEKSTSSSKQAKTVYITSSYLLPKVELSFNYLVPCASEEFVSEIKKLLASAKKDSSKARSFQSPLDRLLLVLKSFGHFVPTTSTLGGKLIASDAKELQQTSDVKDVVSKYAAEAKISLKKMGVGVEAETNYSSGEREQQQDKAKNESQSMTFTAIGGEGTFISNANEWANSVAPYTEWSLISSDGLLPSIDLLPASLYEACVNLLKSEVETLTAQQLMQKNAHFLFYGKYYDLIGKYAKKEYFYIASKNKQVLSLEDANPVDGTKVELAVGKNGDHQLWHMSPLGHIVSKASTDETEYVLTMPEVVSEEAFLPLIVSVKGRSQNQVWDAKGGRILLNNPAVKGEYTVSLRDDDKVGVAAKSANANNSTYAQTWTMIQAAEQEFAQEAGQEEVYFVISSRYKKGYVMTVRDGEGGTAKEQAEIVFAPHVSSRNQLWYTKENSDEIYSALTSSNGNPFVLANVNNKLVLKEKFALKTKTDHMWEFTSDGLKHTRSGQYAIVEKDKDTQGSPIVLAEKGDWRTLSWVKQVVAQNPADAYAKVCKTTSSQDGLDLGLKRLLVSTAPLAINGKIRGIGFVCRTGGSTQWDMLVPRVFVERDGRRTWVEETRSYDELRNSGQYFDFEYSQYIDENPLLLPANQNIKAFSFYQKGGNRLAIRVQADNGEWLENTNTSNDHYFHVGDTKVTYQSFVNDTAAETIGLAFARVDNRLYIETMTREATSAEGYFRLQSQVGDKLFLTLNSDRRTVNLQKLAPGNEQLWRMTADGYIECRTANRSGERLVLDHPNSPNPVYAFTINDGKTPNQLWEWKDGKLICKKEPEKVLRANHSSGREGTQVILLEDDGKMSSLWVQKMDGVSAGLDS